MSGLTLKIHQNFKILIAAKDMKHLNCGYFHHGPIM